MKLFKITITQKIMENPEFLNNFNQDFNEALNSFGIGNLDESENLENDEILKEINQLREKINNRIEDISTVDSSLESRENNFQTEYEKLNNQQKELFKKFENDYILNSNLVENKNNSVFNNLNAEIVNDNNIGMFIYFIYI